MKLTHRQAVITMVASTLMWSIAGVVTRHLEQARGFEVTFWRSFFTMLSLMVILPVLHGSDLKSKFQQGGKTLWVSGLCWSVMFTAFMMALTMTTVANVLVTMAVGPLLTALLARMLIGHRLAFRTWVAIAVGGVGIAYMYADQLNFNDMKQVTGMLVALFVPAAAAVNWTLSQRAQAHGQHVDLVPAVLIGAMISSLITLPFAIPLQATTWDIGLLATLGLVQLAIPCSLAVVCARYLTAPEISLLALLEIIFGILLAWWGAGEVPAKSAMLGGSLVIGALVFNEWLSLQERKQSQLNQVPLT